MKVLLESKTSGWVNFGTVHQSYAKPYSYEVSPSGKVWKVTDEGKKLVWNRCTEKPMTETEFKEMVDLYEYPVDAYTK